MKYSDQPANAGSRPSAAPPAQPPARPPVGPKPRPAILSASPAWRRWFWIVGAPAVLLAGIVILWHRDPSQPGQGYLPCLFHSVTGLYCMGCGTTRALHALVHGRVAEAAGFNLLLILWLPLLGYAGLAAWLRQVWQRPCLPAIPESRSLMILLLISALSFLVLRNLPVPGLAWLAP